MNSYKINFFVRFNLLNNKVIKAKGLCKYIILSLDIFPMVSLEMNEM